MTVIPPTVEIGKYRIQASPTPGKVWIEVIADGEAMEIDEAKLEAAIQKFYRRQF